MSVQIDAELSGIALLRSLPYVNLNLLIEGYKIENISDSKKVNGVWDRGGESQPIFFHEYLQGVNFSLQSPLLGLSKVNITS